MCFKLKRMLLPLPTGRLRLWSRTSQRRIKRWNRWTTTTLNQIWCARQDQGHHRGRSAGCQEKELFWRPWSKLASSKQCPSGRGGASRIHRLGPRSCSRAPALVANDPAVEEGKELDLDDLETVGRRGRVPWRSWPKRARLKQLHWRGRWWSRCGQWCFFLRNCGGEQRYCTGDPEPMDVDEEKGKPEMAKSSRASSGKAPSPRPNLRRRLCRSECCRWRAWAKPTEFDTSAFTSAQDLVWIEPDQHGWNPEQVCRLWPAQCDLALDVRLCPTI